METKFHTSQTTYINKIKLVVKDLENQLKFYTNYLGLRIVDKNDTSALLSANGKDVLIELEKGKDVSIKGPAYGLYHFALLFENETALANVFLNLIKNRYSFEGFSDHGVSKAIYLNDPEGNGIELYVDRPSEKWDFLNGEVNMVTQPLDYQELLAHASQEPFSAINSNTIMGHLHFYVKNLEIAKVFFVDVLGFDVMLNYGGHALFVSSDGYHHHVGFNTWLRGAKQRDENETGLKEYYLNATEENKKEILKRAKEIGVKHLKENGKDVLVDFNGIRVVI